MAKYKEVHDKQQALETMADRDEQMSKGLFVGFTFRHRKMQSGSEGAGARPSSSSPRKPLTSETFGTML